MSLTEVVLDDDLLEICSKLNDVDLENFMKTSKRIGSVCYHEWNKRHTQKYGSGPIDFYHTSNVNN